MRPMGIDRLELVPTVGVDRSVGRPPFVECKRIFCFCNIMESVIQIPRKWLTNGPKCVIIIM